MYYSKDPPKCSSLINESQFNSFMMDNLASNGQTASNNMNVMNVKSNKRHFSGSTSSLQNSEDEDDDYEEGSTPTSREEKRRLSHTAAEQKRRNAIKHGYDELQSLVPSCEFMDPSSSQKHGYQLLQKVLPSQQSPLQTESIISSRTTRADTLEQTIDYIHHLEVEKSKHNENVDTLKKEILALKILKSNYEEVLKCHRNLPQNRMAEINDETKFEIFTQLSDNLFQSFNTMTNTNSFLELSTTMVNWLEQTCNSQSLKSILTLALMHLQNK